MKLPRFHFSSLKISRTTLYFDTNNLELGEYNIVIVLNYEKVTTKKDGKINIVTKDEFEKTKNTGTDPLIIILIIAVIVLAIFLVYVAVLLSKTLNKK